MTDINSTELTKKYPDTPEYRFAAWLSSQSREYNDNGWKDALNRVKGRSEFLLSEFEKEVSE